MRVAGIAAIALVAGCSAERAPEPSASPTVRVAAPRTLVPADFDPAIIGPKIEGPQGTDPEFAVMAGGKEIARVVSYVACPKAMTSCVPGELPEGTVLTYVHTITPAAEAEATLSPTATSSETAGATPIEVPPSLFRMTSPAPGFKGGVGFAFAEAEAALGAKDPVTATLDSGQLIWRVTDGSGWKPGAPVTVWWQTTAPPAGPQAVFRLELNGQTATVKAPFPAAEKTAAR